MSLSGASQDSILEGRLFFPPFPSFHILVIGNTSELDTADKKRSFELFRKGLNQIDIITYDELLERANHIVGTTTLELSSEGCSGAPYGDSSSHQVDYSDLPF